MINIATLQFCYLSLSVDQMLHTAGQAPLLSKLDGGVGVESGYTAVCVQGACVPVE